MTSESWFDEEIFAALRETVSDEILQRLLRLFLENTRNRLEEVTGLDPRAEPERLAVALHALKGSALMVGARELEVVAEDLRAAARRREEAEIDQKVKRLEEALERVHERICQELET
jgi:HPt (histidine-containing phosphotransfer) domain-containing protein